MGLNPQSADDRPIALTTFGGLVTYINPTALPMGVSPDCSDCTFLPGGVSQRPCFKKVFAAPLYPNAQRTYGKSYVMPNGTILNLYFYDNGAITVENLTTAPGVETLLSQTSALNCYAKSVTAFGREYIAISDGLHGQEIPLQFDGTNIDRVTQDGPGAPPTVATLTLPAVVMVSSGAPTVLTVVECDPEGPDGSGYFTSINMYTSSLLTGVAVGDPVTIAGNGTINGGPFTILAIYAGTPNSLIVLSAYLPPGTTFGLGGTATIPGSTATRQNNIVTVTTATPHQLQVGYQAQITGVTPEIVGGNITGIVIDNEDLPGLATVTTASAHGLVPGCNVSISGINANVIASIATAQLQGQVLTVTTTTAHGLSPGAIVSLAGNTAANLNTTVTVQNVTGPTTFTAIIADADTSGTGGDVEIVWPVPDTATPNFFPVVAAPTPTTFQIAINYCDATWGAGSAQLVTFSWNGTFYVTAILSPTSFQYQQYGPNASTSVVGTVTPYGQAAPGVHQIQVLFLTRQGLVTSPSPPAKFVANGGQYISVTNIPIGPSNIVARILAFTGAQGAYFFYLPAPPQVNGIFVGTQTQINDNTTTSVLLDFGDNSLFNGIGISTQGNNLANLDVIDSALGFGKYASRLITYGQRNTVSGLQNLGFDGGSFPNAPTIPTGWTDDGSGGGQLAVGHFGQAWKIAVTPSNPCGAISQTAYEDYTGAPIIEPNTQYYLRAWLKPSAIAADLSFYFILSSASLAFSIAAIVPGSAMSTAGSFVEMPLSGMTPVTIPSDFILQVYAKTTASTLTLLVDELNLVFSESPYETGLIGSYVNNPESFDGVSGPFGPEDDTHQVMDVGIIRSVFYMLTQDPSGRIHETTSGPTEPADWVVNEVAANCGTVSAFSLTRSQADDASASGGEEWFSWLSSTGIRIFGGEEPIKISQEIQRPAGPPFPGAPADLGAINTAAQLKAWGLNDPDQKQMWFGIPSGVATVPNVIYFISYLGLDNASAIASGAPVHRSLSGKMVANDLSRKWSPWQRPMNGGALMYRTPTEIQPVFFGGKQGGVAFGNAYTLNAAQFTDDDYGGMLPYYVTYAFPDRDQEQQLQLGGGMKMVAYTSTLVSGTGIMTILVVPETLAGTWPLSGTYQMQSVPKFDTEWAGGMCQAQRMFFKFLFAPLAGTTDVAFNLDSLTVWLKQSKHMPVRGAYP